MPATTSPRCSGARRRNSIFKPDPLRSELAAQLLPIVKLLEDDFYSSDARFVANDLREMASLSSEHFRGKHPGIAEDIVNAFAWCYTFDFQ